MIELNLFTNDNLVVSCGGDRDQLKQASIAWSERITSIQRQDPETVLGDLRRTYHKKLQQLWSLWSQQDDITQELDRELRELKAKREISRTGDTDEIWFVSEPGSDNPDHKAIKSLHSFQTRLLPINAEVDSVIEELDWVPSDLVHTDVDRLVLGEDIEQVVERRCHQQYVRQREERIAILQAQLAVINEARQQALALELDRERAIQQMMNQPPTTASD